MLRFKLTIILLFAALQVIGQAVPPEDLARDFAKEGISFLEEGNEEDALKSLRIAAKLSPSNPEYTHLIAQVLFRQKEYEEVMTTVFPLIKNSLATAKTYQLYGNSLDMLGATERAVLVYKEGLRKFDRPGPLYMELGVVEYVRENDELARQYWEEGILHDPGTAGNYYWASKSYAKSPELIRAMIYAELFLNLERSGDRTREISKLLFEIYGNAIEMMTDSSLVFSCSVSSPDSIRSYDLTRLKRFSFADAFTFSWLRRNTLAESEFSVAQFNALRQVFFENWFDWFAKKYRLDYFDWLRNMYGTKALEAYNYWLMFDGAPDEFKAWYAGHTEDYALFEAWFVRNPMPSQGKRPFSPKLFLH